MHIEFLVEEPSAEAALCEFLPKVVGEQVEFRIHPHQGKRDLLHSLPGKLAGYSKWLPGDWRVVVLLDLDNDDCRALKRKLERIARRANLRTKTIAKGRGPYCVLNRIAIEELEAWFFGDVEALCAAFPRVRASLATRRGFTDPDRIAGGTWEHLERVLQRVGYFKSGLATIAAARAIARHMDPSRNRSRSFRVFRDGLQAMLAS